MSNQVLRSRLPRRAHASHLCVLKLSPASQGFPNRMSSLGPQRRQPERCLCATSALGPPRGNTRDGQHPYETLDASVDEAFRVQVFPILGMALLLADAGEGGWAVELYALVSR